MTSIVTKILEIKPLTAEAFAQYGDVIAVSEGQRSFSINDGYTMRYHDLATIDTLQKNGRTLVSIFRSTPLALPIAIKMMERHPLSSQAFMPLGDQPYLVVVAPKDEFDENNIEVFLANSDQGINYHAGTWHHYCLALHQVSDFLVIDRGDSKGSKNENCDVVKLDGSKVIKL
ncbi:MAG: ureidoglycolate lyase [Gammaproteobacteria bacterium]|nr:MAG: ureidoglycolate lyase [Gammaproteobacteria bacterium]